jgi:hypothetical protein
MSALVLVQRPVGRGPFSDFEAWKRAFDSDPVGRAEHGVTRHWIYRSPEADYVVIGLEFASLEEANAFKTDLDSTLGEVWARMGIDGSAARALEEAETVPIDRREILRGRCRRRTSRSCGNSSGTFKRW